MTKGKPRIAIRNNSFQEVDDADIDYDVRNASEFVGSHINTIPLQSSVASTRNFYGARFVNQSLPILNGEAPLVQNMDPESGKSFDEIMGDYLGNVRAKDAGEVLDVTPDEVTLRLQDGTKKKVSLYNGFPMNRKTMIQNFLRVKKGDLVEPGQLLAHSNFTDPEGRNAMGLNARIGVVPYMGKSMDDAIVVSESFAKRMTSNHMYGYDTEYKRGIKGGKNHFISLFPEQFVKDQLEKLDEDGVIKEGMTVNPGDPVILATKPRVISSESAQLGNLSKHMRNSRSDASTVWEHHTPGIVRDVRRTRSGVKLNIETNSPTHLGDKIVLRPGAKGTISEIIPDEHMPRTKDGRPLEVLLNHLSLPSRTNAQTIFEILLGKVAEKTGKPYVLPSFNAPGERWIDYVRNELKNNELDITEEVFDPKHNRTLENPITVGNAYIMKLHHQAEGKMSARGLGAYNANQQPLHGSGDAASSKRMSALEVHALMSAGAYSTLRDGATIRGARNDEYWNAMRSGYTPKEPGAPFVWDKFKALLMGAGMISRKLPAGVERLTFMTDKDLERVKPVELKNGEIVNINTLEPVKGGLFDPAITGTGSWGKITLPERLPNPMAEDVIVKLLGLTRKQYRDILAGRAELPEELR